MGRCHVRAAILEMFFHFFARCYTNVDPKQPIKVQPETSMLAMPAVTTTENQNGKMKHDNKMLLHMILKLKMCSSDFETMN